MRRTLEKLAQQRQEKEEKLHKQINEINKKSQNISGFPSDDSLEKRITHLEDLISHIPELIRATAELMDAKDKEWDALSSNHVGMIFKSMEWRVDKLAAGYEDANLLMKKFLLLKEKLSQLLAALEQKKPPSPSQIKEMIEPLEDWRYAGFENRFRGSRDDVLKQQETYLQYFKNAGHVLDLGCGRGEFLELLTENSIPAEGVDINSQMIEICKEKGLNCLQADMIEKLADYPDNSLGGIFSSQVIEHLPPAYLKRLIDLAYVKLAPSGPIILETINPASVFTLVQIYFLDLSHQQPIHPNTLKFLLESSGFEDVEIIYSAPIESEQLHNIPGADETTSVLNQNIDNLNNLLYSPSNYAAVGNKK